MGARWLFVLVLLLAPTLASAQAVFDGTTGGQVAGSVADFTIDVSQSTVVGGSAFNSFSSFSIPEGESLTFTDAAQVSPISNIINRVTGTDVSFINGTLDSNVAGAAVYLFNPNGVVVGPTGSINVRNGLHVSSGHHLNFASGEVLTASSGNSTFTSAAPASFGFSSAPAGDIVLNGQVSGGNEIGRELELVGENISLTGVNINLPQDGKVSLSARSRVDITASSIGGAFPGGHFLIAAPDITLIGSDLLLDTVLPGAAGEMRLTGDHISLLEGSRIKGNSTSEAPASNTFITARLLEVSGGSIISADSCILGGCARFRPPGSVFGEAGTIFIDADVIAVTDGGLLSATAGEQGSAGTIVVCCGSSFTVSGVGSLVTAGTWPGSSGNGGKVFISSGSVTMTDGGRMTVATEGTGAAGSINVRAGTFTASDATRLPGSPDADATGLATVSGASGAPGGGGGRIAIEAGTFLLQGGAVVTTDTSGVSPAGSIDIRASEFTVSGVQTKLVSQARGAARGNAGNVTIGANNITFTDGATLSTFSESGAGGNIRLDWNSVTTITGSTISTEVKSGNLDSGNIFFAASPLPPLGFEAEFLAFCQQLLDVYQGLPAYDPDYTGPKTLVIGQGSTITCANAGGGFACRPPTPLNVTCIGRDCNRIDTTSATYPPNRNTSFTVFTPPPVVVVPERNVTTRCGRSGQRSAMSDSYSGSGSVSGDPSALAPAGAAAPRTAQGATSRACSG